MVNIAIIGGGIAGLSAAYYLSSQDMDIDIYERQSKLGGRIMSTNYKEKVIDQGAEFFIDDNESLLTLIQDLQGENFSIEIEDYISTRAIFDRKTGKFTIFPNDKYSKLQNLWWTLGNIRFVGLRNFKSLMKLKELVVKYFDDIGLFYQQIENKPLNLMFAESKKHFTHYLSQSLRESFTSEGISNELVDRFVSPLVSNIYMKNVDQLSSFLGALTFAAKSKRILHVKGGNSIIIDAIHSSIKKKGININTNSEIWSVTKADNRFTIESNKGFKNYDFVFLAIPLNAIRNIKFKGFNEETNQYIDSLPSDYNHVYHHLVKGSIKSKLQKIFSKGVDTVFTNTTQDIWEINHVGDDIYDITSENSFPKTNFGLFFNKVELINSQYWANAYPHYDFKMINQLPVGFQIKPDDQIYFGTESIVSSIDSSVKVAKRVVQNIQKKLKPISLVLDQ